MLVHRHRHCYTLHHFITLSPEAAMNYPQQATVNTGNLVHTNWVNGETVWILSSDGKLCQIARTKDSKEAEGTLRREALVFEDES